VRDARLRRRVGAKIDELRKAKKFDLVLGEPPARTPSSAQSAHERIHKGRDQGAPRQDTFLVESLSKGLATVRAEKGGDVQVVRSSQLVVVKRFGETVFPSLPKVESVEHGDEPNYVLIESDNYHALQRLSRWSSACWSGMRLARKGPRGDPRPRRRGSGVSGPVGRAEPPDARGGATSEPRSSSRARGSACRSGTASADRCCLRGVSRAAPT